MKRRTVEMKPLRLYDSETIDVNSIEEGDLVVARVESFWNNIIALKVSAGEFYDIDAEMRLWDFNTYDSDLKNGKMVVSLIGRNIVARVIGKTEDKLLLERRTIVAETMEMLIDAFSRNEVINATVENIVPYGAFCDIGNGISALLPITDVSKCRYTDLNLLFKKGSRIKVKVSGYDQETSYFTVSRKMAYDKVELKDGMIITVMCSKATIDNTGIYVEVNPAYNGIMDFPENMTVASFKEAEKAVVVVKKVVDAGFRCDFIHKL